jgi:hypothetical protein
VASKEIELWTKSKADFEAVRDRHMRERAREFQNLARLRIDDPSKRQKTVEITDLLLGADWMRVYPAGMPKQMSGPPSPPDSISFEPAHWPELSREAVTLHGAIEDCYRAYRQYWRAYDLLTDEEKQKVDAQPKP